jgi:hypothetical protein
MRELLIVAISGLRRGRVANVTNKRSVQIVTMVRGNVSLGSNPTLAITVTVYSSTLYVR